MWHVIWFPLRWFLIFVLVVPQCLISFSKRLLFSRPTDVVIEKNRNNAAIGITGGRSTYTLDLIRILSKAGHSMHSIETPFTHPLYLSYLSSYVTKRHVVSCYPNDQPEKYARELGQICGQNGLRYLISTCEEIMWVSKFKHLITEEYRKFNSEQELIICVEDFEVMLKLHNKFAFNQLLTTLPASEQWQAPESSLLHTKSDLENYLEANYSKYVEKKQLSDDRLDVVLKPAYSRFASNLLVRPTLNEIRNLFKNQNQKLEGGPWVAQRFIDGTMLCSYSIANKGKIQAHAVYYGGIYTSSGEPVGSSIYYENVVTDADGILPFVDSIVSATGFTGQICFDIIRCKNTGKLYPIECNPRATSGIHLFRTNNPLQFSECLLGTYTQTEMVTPKSNSVQVSVAMVLSLAVLLKVNSITDITQWYKKFMAAEDIVIDQGDLYMGVWMHFLAVCLGIRILRNKIPLERALTYDVEFNEEGEL